MVFRQSLHFGDKLDHSLLCPNQIRDSGNRVEDTPRQCDPRSLHGITIQAQGRLNSLFIPLRMEEMTSHLDTGKPTEEELATARFCEATADAPWDPHSKRFVEKEKAVRSRVSRVSKACKSKQMIQATQLQKISEPRNLSVCSRPRHGEKPHKMGFHVELPNVFHPLLLSVGHLQSVAMHKKDGHSKEHV